MKTYELKIGNLKRDLPIIPLSKDLSIGSFVILGDFELIEEITPLLADKLPTFDVLVTAEAKGIPLAHEMARFLNHKKYIVARKSEKSYMNHSLSISLQSITTKNMQKLYLDGIDAQFIKGKKVVILDDVISTGESINALEKLVLKAGGKVVAKACILAEGQAKNRKDIIYLEELPLFP